MIDLATLATFMAVVLGLFLVPGPAMLLLVTRTAQGGRAVGVATGAGIAAGDFLHTLLAAFGLSALLMTSALAFSVVKLCGAAYLLYLGVRAFLAKPSTEAAPHGEAAPGVISASRAFWQAIPAEMLNPKTALFFLAFMPQFVHAERGHALAQFLILGLVFVAMSLVYSAAVACAMGPLGRVTRRLRWLQRWKGKLIGTIFMTLGVRVAFQQQ
ncbi:MAG: LysE family translocator [Burkholderiales bacterium]|nr:LysE family translocator [Burkholderiales bacterium]